MLVEDPATVEVETQILQLSPHLDRACYFYGDSRRRPMSYIMEKHRLRLMGRHFEPHHFDRTDHPCCEITSRDRFPPVSPSD